MYPTLTPGEYVTFNQLAYRKNFPQRGDIVLAIQPGPSRRLIIKRVIGLPGDQVILNDDNCFVRNQSCDDSGPKLLTELLHTLSPDEYILLGDSPELSTDARQFGPVSMASILGRAWLVYWPPRRIRLVTKENRPP